MTGKGGAKPDMRCWSFCKTDFELPVASVGCWRGKNDPDPLQGKLQCNHPDAVLEFTLPDLPPRADFTNTGRSTQEIMGDYYPVAVWCDKYAFEHGGWRACLRD